MTIGWFGRCFNVNHKSLSTKTHIANNGKVLCGYKPHKTLEFNWCSGVDNLEYLECKKCKEKLLKEKIKWIKQYTNY